MGRAYAQTGVNADGTPTYGWIDVGFDGTWSGTGDTSEVPTDWSGILSSFLPGNASPNSMLGTAGLGLLLNNMMGSGSGGFKGYAGGIPNLVGNRTKLPIPTTRTITPAVAAAPATAEVPATATTPYIPAVPARTAVPAVTAPRRAGSGGITYFSPMVYSPTGSNPNISAAPSAAVTTTTPTTTPTTTTVGVAGGGAIHRAGGGGISSLGKYSDGGQLLRGPGDGVSDSIPATIGGNQKAALADGEFVIPARIVSELGNGSTEAGARKLYAMMDRIKKARKKARNIAADTKVDKHLPA